MGSIWLEKNFIFEACGFCFIRLHIYIYTYIGMYNIHIYLYKLNKIRVYFKLERTIW